MSIGASVASFEHDGRKINLIDTPGDPSFVADTIAALRVADSAVVVVNAVMGVEVNTERLWQRADREGLARLVFVNMLDRERADFFRALESLQKAFGSHVVATEIPIGSEHEVSGVIDLIDMKAFVAQGEGQGAAAEQEIPEELAGAGQRVPREADGRGRRELRRADGALPRRRADRPRRDRLGAEARASPTAGSSRSPAASRPGTSARAGCWRRWSRTCPRRRCAARSRPSTTTARRSTSSPTRTASWSPTSSRPSPTPTPGRLNLFRVYSRRAQGATRRSPTSPAAPRSASARCWSRRARSTSRSTSSAPATSAPSRS